ncbi:zeta toxin family protein [Dactylosporangium sp. CA-092794]|uniref:zeta toxin family protein n=1 Tax=Dactylosporangium sp. CA-092794 TaxID=3239929 RepID=UPI003D8E70F6
MTGAADDTLPEEENERIFRQEIVPRYLDRAVPQQRPVVVIVGGQTGAGKSAVTKMVERAMGERGSFAKINMDDYNPWHPRFTQWQREDEAAASARVRPDGDRWWEKAQQYAIDNRFNVVLESAMRSPAEFEEIAERFRGADYHVEAAVVAVSPATSRLGILSRYQDELEATGRGRYIEPAVHDECLDGVARGAAAVDTGRLAHTAFAFRRSGEVVYANQIGPDGAWKAPAGFATAIEQEQRRPWTDAERAWYRRETSSLRDRVDPAHRSELDAIDRVAEPNLADPEEPQAFDAAAERLQRARASLAQARERYEQDAAAEERERRDGLDERGEHRRPAEPQAREPEQQPER